MRATRPAKLVFRGLSSNRMQVAIVITSLYALFAEDIKLAAFSPTVDPVFRVLTISAFSLFSAEIVFCSLLFEGYFLSFFFLCAKSPRLRFRLQL